MGPSITEVPVVKRGYPDSRGGDGEQPSDGLIEGNQATCCQEARRGWRNGRINAMTGTEIVQEDGAMDSRALYCVSDSP